MKLLFLFIYSQGELYDKMKVLQQSYMHLYEHATCYFITFDPDLDEDIAIKDDTIYVKGHEALLNILDKTVKSLEYLLLTKNLHFDYIIRTNVSTVVNIPKITEHLQNYPTTNVYTCAYRIILQLLDERAGITDKSLFGTTFASGISIIMSHDVCKHMLQNKDKLRYDIVDDVAIGVYMKNYQPEATKQLNHLFSGTVSVRSTVPETIERDLDFYRNNTLDFNNKNKHDRAFDLLSMEYIVNNIIMFPKIIYMTHKTLDHIEKHSVNWQKLNPDYQIKLYDDAMCQDFLKSVNPLYYDIFMHIPDGPIKCDFWRLCVLYEYGGVYVDADIEPFVPISEMVESPSIDFFTCNSVWGDHVNPHIIICKKREPILKQCIDIYVDYYNTKREYQYWAWSVMKIMNVVLDPLLPKSDKKIYQEGIYTIKGKTYQMITEDFVPAPHCTYQGKTLLNNRYSFYDESSHSFAPPQKTIDDDQWLQKCNDFIAKVPAHTITVPRGVIICAADRHFVCSYLTIQWLLQQDPDIQIEYYYVEGELVEFQKKLLQSIENIELINCMDVLPHWFPHTIMKTHLQGPMMKSFALMVSKFDEILLLSGNNSILESTSTLFDALSQHTAIVWKNKPKELTAEQASVYKTLHISDPNFICDSSQILVRKSNTYQALCLGYFLHYHHETFYKYFDKGHDLTPMAFQVTNTPYFVCPAMPHCASTINSTDVNILIQHHPITQTPLFVNRITNHTTINTFHHVQYYMGDITQVTEPTNDLPDILVRYQSSDVMTNFQNLSVHYRDNIEALLTHYVGHIRSCISMDNFVYVLNDIPLLERSLVEIKIYLSRNIFHLNSSLIYLLHTKQYDLFMSVFKQIMDIADDETINIGNNFLLHSPRSLPDILAVVPLKYKFFPLAYASGHNIVSSQELSAYLKKESDPFLNQMGHAYENIHNPKQTEIVFRELLRNPTIIPTYQYPIYLSSFYNTSFNNHNNSYIKKMVSTLHRKLYPSMNTTHTSKKEITAVKRKIGFISTNFKNHSVCRDRCGVICHMNKDLFDVVIFYFSKHPDSIYYNKLVNAGHKNVYLEKSFDNWKQIVANENLDILVFCDIGMQTETYLMAHCRFAPIQMNTWGHSETSGINTIDYYVSSELYELEDAHTHYSERLIKQKSLCTFYYSTMFYSLAYDNRDKKLVPLDKEKYILFPHYLHKVSSEDMYIFSRILQNTSNDIKLAFIDGNTNALDNVPYRQKIISYFTEYKDRVVILPSMHTGNFYDVMKRSLLVLDSFPHGSCNAALESFYNGKVLVTLPSNYLRGRFAQGFYKKMGITECIVDTPQQYYQTVIKLIEDPKWRQSIEQKIVAKQHVLFHDLESLHEWNVMLHTIEPVK